MKDSTKYISSLIAKGEHQQQDFKFEISNARKIAKTLSAFANTDGGRLLIGVKDNGRIAGIRSEEEYYMIEAAADMYCKPPIPFTSVDHLVEGKNILEVLIEPSDKMPHYAQLDDGSWKAYHRVDDNNLLANYILRQVWKRKKRKTGTFIQYSESEERVLSFLEERELVTIEEIKKALKMRKKELQQVLINLIALQVVKMHFEKEEMQFSSAGPEME